MSVSDLHSKFTFNRAHWLRILQQDHHHHVRSSFFSWWSIKLHQTNSRQKSFMRFLYSFFLGLLEFECEWCLLPSPPFFFFLRVISNKAVHQQQTWWVVVRYAFRWWCHIFVFSLWWFAWYSTFLWKLNVRRTIMCCCKLLSRKRNDTRTNKLFLWNF